MNNELIKTINGKEYHFKFKSKKLIDLEKLTGKSIIDLLQDMSMSNVARLLKYACLDEVNEYDLLDDLLSEMTYEDVITKIIMETCVVSGIISKVDMDKIYDKQTELRNEKN